MLRVYIFCISIRMKQLINQFSIQLNKTVLEKELYIEKKKGFELEKKFSRIIISLIYRNDKTYLSE